MFWSPKFTECIIVYQRDTMLMFVFLVLRTDSTSNTTQQHSFNLKKHGDWGP